MNSNKIRANHWITAAAGACALAALLQVPATAAQDRGEGVSNRVTVRSAACALERVERQYVRCDNLTGAGVSAPLWMPERHRASAVASGAGGGQSGTPRAPWDFAP